MAALPYIQLYVADYLADTAHLTVTESGAYLHLIMNYWQTGKPLLNNDARLAAIAKCFNGEWTQVKPAVVEFFEERDGYLHHPRIDRDLNKVGRGGDDPELAGAWKGYVYFITSGPRDGYKIGYSKNPWARLKDLQTGSSKKLLLVATLKTTVVSEKALHDELAEYRTQGEWFSASPMIEALISAVKAKKLATVDEAVSYCRNYGKTTVVATKDTDTDTDTEEKKSGADADVFLRASKAPSEGPTVDSLLANVSPQVVADFKKLRTTKKAPITLTALEGIQREAGKAGVTLERALAVCCERAWVGFKADWFTGQATTTGPTPPRRKELA